MEARVVPANLLFIGDNVLNNWSGAANWCIIGTGAPKAPAADDALFIDPTMSFNAGGKTYQGTNKDSRCDLDVAFRSLTVSNAFTKLIYVANDLTVTTSLTLYGGKVTRDQAGGDGELIVQPAAGFFGSAHFAGTILNLDVKLGGGTTTTIAADLILDGDLDNSGGVQWNLGDIELNGTITNRFGGSFTVRCDKELADTDPQGLSSFVNEGNFLKTLGAAGPGTRIETPFSNSGPSAQFYLLQGTLELAGGVAQSGANSLTSCGVGTTLITPVFTVDAGKFYGASAFYGLLANIGGTVSPGTFNTAVGTLTIYGNYQQGAGGTLYIDTAGLGAAQTDLLRVVAHQGAGGNVELAGRITFHRDPNFTPGDISRDFLSAATPILIVGPLTWGSDPINDLWRDATGMVRTFQRYRFTNNDTTMTFDIW